MEMLTPTWAAAGVMAAGAKIAATASRVIAVRLIMTSSYARSPALSLRGHPRLFEIRIQRSARALADHGIRAPIQPTFRHRPDTILYKRKRARLPGPAFVRQTLLATIVVAIVGIRDAVVIPVAVRSALAVVLVLVRDTVAVTVPAARHIAPLLATADGHALPGIGDIAVACAGRFPMARIPDVAVVDQAGVTGRPEVAGTRRRHRLVDGRRWRGAEGDAHLRGGRRDRRQGHRRGGEDCGSGKGRDRHTLQHDLPPLMRGRNGPRLKTTTHITPCAFHPDWRNSGAHFAVFRSR